MKISKKIKIYLRSLTLTTVILFCFSFGLLGSAKAFEGIRKIGFGEYRNAIEYKDGTLKIFDFEINLAETFKEKEI